MLLMMMAARTPRAGRVAHYSAGSSFGELALMYNCPRAATVVCDKDGVLWGIERQKFNMILMQGNQKLLQDKGTFLKVTEAQRRRDGGVTAV